MLILAGFLTIFALAFNMHLGMCITRANYERNQMTLRDATKNTNNAIKGIYTDNYRVDQMSADKHIWLLLTFRNALARYKDV